MKPTAKPTLEIIPLKPAVRADAETALEVLVRLVAPETQLPERPRLNLSLVLDRSGSMAGDKIKKAREAAAYAVQQLFPQDRVALVVYDDAVETVWPSAPVTDKAAVLEAIRRIQDRGSTDLFGGWTEGATQVAAHLAPGAVNRVLLLTDGLANQGVTDPAEIGQHVLALARRGVGTTTLGVGRDFNEDLLSLMADRGEGNFYFIEGAADLPRIFARELSGLSATFAKGLRLAVGTGGVEMLNDFDRDDAGRHRLPDLIAGLPLELALRLRTQGSTTLELRLAYDGPGGEQAEVSHALSLPAVSQAEFAALPEDPRVSAYLAKLEATRARALAMAQMDRGDLEGAKATIAAAAPVAAQYSSFYAEADELEQLKRELETDQVTARKRMSEQTLRNRKGK